MARWDNFTIWKGRFPHWRADNVEYYVTFPHRKPLSLDQCNLLFGHLMRAHGRTFTYLALVVVPEKTEALLAVDKEDTELNDVLIKAQKRFIKAAKSEDRLFYAEPYDRIVRDEEERLKFLEGIMGAPEGSPHIESEDEWLSIFVATAE